MLFIILFLHQTTTVAGGGHDPSSCLSSCSYIKPQHDHGHRHHVRGCLSSCSYIKPQPIMCDDKLQARCLSSCSYNKPQPFRHLPFRGTVVYHLVPTSNHNRDNTRKQHVLVVYHLVPTSNHNKQADYFVVIVLFIILFLHQTTTSFRYQCPRFCCLSSCSYIKPQRPLYLMRMVFVVYHLVPTSNHNPQVSTRIWL